MKRWLQGNWIRIIVYGTLLCAVVAVVWGRTLPGRRVEYGLLVHHRLRPYFTRSNVPYPPKRLVITAFKDTKTLQLYAPDANGRMRFIRAYPILAASGDPGPKLHEGDNQVPEGIYHIDAFNPRSSFHLALHLNYPNAFDRAMAVREGRTELGGDIMIHGSAVSAGCLAMGDATAEDLFILAADTGLRHITVIMSPVDFRIKHFSKSSPSWVPKLYGHIREQLQMLPQP